MLTCPVPVAPTVKTTVGRFADGVIDVAVEAQGQPNTPLGSHMIELDAEAIDPGYAEPGFSDHWSHWRDENNQLSVRLSQSVNGWAITVTVDNVEIGTATPTCEALAV